MNYPLHLKPYSGEIARFTRAAIVSGFSTLLDFTLLIVLSEFAGLPVLLANVISSLIGVISSFTMNRCWTYPETRSRPLGKQFARFFLVSMVGLLLSSSIVGLLHESTGYIAAKAVATIVVFFWNFLTNRYWTFSVPTIEWVVGEPGRRGYGENNPCCR
jgi:putative flippase GtrA